MHEFLPMVGIVLAVVAPVLFLFAYKAKQIPREAKNLSNILKSKMGIADFSEAQRQQEIDYIDMAVNRTRRKDTREEGLTLLRSAAKHSSTWLMRDISSAVHALRDRSKPTAMTVPTHEQMMIHAAYTDALTAAGPNRLQVPRLTPMMPDRRNGDVFYTLLRYAMQHTDDAWVLLAIAADNEITEVPQAMKLLIKFRQDDFQELLQDSPSE